MAISARPRPIRWASRSAPPHAGMIASDDLVEADPDVVRRDADVSGDGDLRAAAERVAVQRGDDRKREGRDPVEHAAHPPGHGHRVLVRANGRQLLQVTAGDERAVAAAADHQHGRVRRLHLIERRIELDPPWRSRWRCVPTAGRR